MCNTKEEIESNVARLRQREGDSRGGKAAEQEQKEQPRPGQRRQLPAAQQTRPGPRSSSGGVSCVVPCVPSAGHCSQDKDVNQPLVGSFGPVCPSAPLPRLHFVAGFDLWANAAAVFSAL